MQAPAEIGTGAFMEKKTGNIDMEGRRASTSRVLSQNLANLISDVYAFLVKSCLLLNAVFQMSSYAHISLPFLDFLDLRLWFIHLTNMEFR